VMCNVFWVVWFLFVVSVVFLCGVCVFCVCVFDLCGYGAGLVCL